jgi:predicted phosphodiesterase
MQIINKKNLYFVGDTHSLGISASMFSNIPKDSLIIHVGDFGFGFQSKEKDERWLHIINDELKENNNITCVQRGNHDLPQAFDGRYSFSNLILAPDYTQIKWNDLTILLVGGAISIDRQARTQGVDYWENEGFVLDLNKAKKSDILITHSAPSYCSPVGLNDFVRGWAKADKRGTMLQELEEERRNHDILIDHVKPFLHCYGHYHLASYQKIYGVIHKCLDINEVWSPEI